MLSFRQKIFIAYVVAFITFLLLLYPFATRTVQRIAIKALEDRASSLIEKIQSAPDNDDLVERIKLLKATAFFRVSVISDERKVLYDSHTKRLLGSQFSQDYVINHPEVLQAFEAGVGYHEDYSKLLAQHFTYMAKVFDFHGKPYVLRIAFPYEYVSQLTHDLGFGFLLFTAVILLLFSLLTWFIIHYLTRPIQEIIDAVKPYRKGETQVIPHIKLSSLSPHDDFSQLSDTLNSLSDKIQSHIDSLKDFVANASHELKTPITIIQGFAETLHDNPDLPRKTQEEITEKIVRNSIRMETIIKDLLILTSLENIPESRVEQCDIEQILLKCCATVQQVHPTAKISLTKTGNKFNFLGDSSLLELAFNNLIENAAKYSNPPAVISIHLRTIKEQIEITIADKGIGIPEADLGRIFERFYTVDKAHSRKMGGSGLGLSIVNMIISKHNGRISVSSKVGEGTTFLVKLSR